MKFSFFVPGVLFICVASAPALAKGPTTRITIENPRFTRPIVITDAAIIKDFQVFAGPGTSTNESRSLIIDWASGVVSPPAGLESYKVSFHVGGYLHPYVVLYAPDRSTKMGYVYLPGREDRWYGTNVGMIYRRLEGNWFRVLSRWEDLARPMIEKQLSQSVPTNSIDPVQKTPLPK